MYEFEHSADYRIEQLAADRVLSANQFRLDTVRRYKDAYHAFWGIDREDITVLDINLMLMKLGAEGLKILTDSYQYALKLREVYGSDELEDRYLDIPYERDEQTGALTTLKEAWVSND